jgi:hypothetical protein
MSTVEVAFAAMVSLLAAVCVILALVFAICWLWAALRRVLAQLRPPTVEEEYRTLSGQRR